MPIGRPLTPGRDVVAYEARAALSRAGAGIPPLFGVRNTQLLDAPASSVGFLRTVAAGVGVLDTGQAPPAGHEFRIIIDWSVRDVTTGAGAYGSIQALLKNVGGVLTIFATASHLGGDAALATAAATVIAPGATLEIQATPPAVFADTLDWKFDVTITPN